MLFLEQTQGFGGSDGAIAGQQSPSLYELLMQERMASGFKPALEYLVQTICDAYPRVSATLPVRHLDESYAIVMALMERYFLNRYDSLAGEKFYGIKRVMYNAAAAETPATDAAGGGGQASVAPLTAQARNRSLLLAVLMPYLKTKLDVLHRSLAASPSSSASSSANTSQRDDDASTEDDISRTTNHTGTAAMVANAQHRWRVFMRSFRRLRGLATLKKLFVKSYPFMHLSYEASFFLYQWLYLFGDTPYFSPFLRRLGVVLVRVSPTDETAILQKQNEYRSKVLTTLAGKSIVQRMRRGLVQTSWAVYDHSYVLLMMGIASYKFLEWMYSDEGTAAAVKIRATGTEAPTPPPPVAPLFAGNAAVLLSTVDAAATCPLCQKRRVNPAASVSGFVFCYPCLYRHVDENGTCPVTQIKCDITSITKIYDDATS